jgi:imidazolonepropionase-like amidohydrolase
VNPDETQGPVAYVGATAIPGDGRLPFTDSVLLVENGRIIALGDQHTPIPDAAVRVDLTGKFVLPGLTEGHAHVSGFASEAYHPDEPGAFRAAPPLMEDLLSWGVTTVRDTGGPDLESTQGLQRHSEVWPRFFGSGPNLDGSPGGPWKGMWKTEEPSEVGDLVTAEAEGGMDFIKVYAWMTEPVLLEAIRAAHRHGLPIAGHVGYTVTAERAVELGIDALEHIRIGPELIPADRMAEYRALPFRPRDEMAAVTPWRFIDLDSAAVDRVIGKFVRAGTYLTPTLAIHESHLAPASHSPGDKNFHDDSVTGELQHDPEDDVQVARMQFDRIVEFVGRAYASGVRVVAGSDTPSPALPPGASLHRELALLVQAGLTPLQAIEAATYTPAKLLGRSHETGSLRLGNRADLVVLGADPLADITNSSAIETVLLAGRTVRTGAPLNGPA